MRRYADDNGFPVCRATAFNAAGQPLFDQDVEWVLDFPSGPPLLEGAHGLRYVWYFATPKMTRPTSSTSR